ncbi:MAG: hypothetical protein ACJ71T_15120 [Actinomycetales bacterium]
MTWRRSIALALTVVLGVVLLIGLGVVALVTGVNLQHPRDETGYLTYLRTYGDMSSDQPIELPAHAGLVSAGQDACSWLSGSEFALWQTSVHHRFPARMDAYLRSRGAQPALPWSGPPDRSAVAAAAWAYLCPATWELHKPHYVFSSPPGD